MMILNISTAEELADLADEDYGMQNASDVEITLGGTADTDTVVIDPPETRRRSRMLLDSDDDDNNDSSNVRPPEPLTLYISNLDHRHLRPSNLMLVI